MLWNVFFWGSNLYANFFPNSDSKLKKIYKNYVDSWCFNNKNVFTGEELYREMGGLGEKPQNGQFKSF